MLHRMCLALLVIALLGLLAPTAFADEGKAPPAESKTVTMLGGAPEKVKLTAEEQQFLDLTNKERKANGLRELTVAPLLVAVARDKSKEMHDLKYWGHQSPIKEKQTAMRRVLWFLPEVPKSMTVGENLCLSSCVNVEAGHKALMDSPTHKKNILNPDYEYVGFGSYIAADGRFWTTEIFLKVKY